MAQLQFDNEARRHFFLQLSCAPNRTLAKLARARLIGFALNPFDLEALEAFSGQTLICALVVVRADNNNNNRQDDRQMAFAGGGANLAKWLIAKSHSQTHALGANPIALATHDTC